MNTKIINIQSLFFFIIFSFSFCVTAQDKWKEVRFEDEVVITKSSENQFKGGGYTFARKNAITHIIATDNLREARDIVINDLKRYIPLACEAKVKFFNEKEKNSVIGGDHVIILATSNSDSLLKWAGLKDKVRSIRIDEQECLIFPSKIKFQDLSCMVLIGGSKRGLLNGVYTFLEQSINIHWYPPRVYFNNEEAYPAETILSQSDKLVWNEGELLWTPAISDRVCYNGLSKKFINWASHNRINIFVSGTNPLNKSLVDYAHNLGIKVLSLDMTHRLPKDAPVIPHSSKEAIQMSTNMFLNRFKKYNLDGMAWHTASENITLEIDVAYQKKSRVEWETIYFNSYEKAIRKVKKDAMLVMLMGWTYMDPASEISKRVSKNTISWIVPTTQIIDASMADIEEYEKHFYRIWYWLYSGVSRDGTFPMVKIDYLEKYVRKAIKYNHGLAGQGIPSSNTANVMYLVEAGEKGVIPAKEYLHRFGELYYGDSRMGETLLKYQEALKSHRSWFNNIHTRDIENYFTTFEALELKDVFRTVMDCAKIAKTPLIKDRLKTLAVTTIRCFIRRGYGSYASKIVVSNDELNQMIEEAKSLFSDHYFGKENDFFGEELLRLEKQL